MNQMNKTNGEIEYLVDDNLKTDYGRIQMLLNKSRNIETMEQIIASGNTHSKIINRFSFNEIHEPKNFLSLLYYMGMTTIDADPETGDSMLRIPNYSIKTIYWEYMEKIIMAQNPGMRYDPSVIRDGLRIMAFKGIYEQFFIDFRTNFVSQLSNRDLANLSEKNIKFLLLSILFQENYYLPLSETENSNGYSDIYLQRRNYLYPKIPTDWVWELKYVKQADAQNETVINDAKTEATKQLRRYKTSNLFRDRTDVRYLSIVFVGKTDCIVEEFT
jgi:hypothetical protein